MHQDKLEEAIQDVINTNHYSKQEIIKFREFMKELAKDDNTNMETSIDEEIDAINISCKKK